MATSAFPNHLHVGAPRSCALLQHILDQLPAAVYVTDEEGRLTYFNQAAVEFSGRIPEIGTDRWCVSWKLYHPDGSPMPHDECPMAVTLKEQREVVGAEAIAERPDGHRVPFMPYPSLLRDESGEVVGAVNMLVDLTEAHRAKEALRASEDNYERLLGLLPVAVYTCEAPSGEITYFNHQAEALWGRRPKLRDTSDVFCGSFKIWRPDGTHLAHRDTPMALALTKGERSRDQDVILERPDGSRISALANIDPIRDASGTVVGAVNVLTDITRIKEAERELERRTAQLAAFLETAALGLHRVGLDGTILWANEAELQMLGYTSEEYIGQNIEDFHVDRPVIADIMHRLSRGEKLRDYEARLRCKDDR